MRRDQKKLKHNRRAAAQRRGEIERMVDSSGDTDGFASFDHPTEITCEDCSLENALGIDSKPRRLGRIPLRPSRVSKWRPLATKRCEQCQGTGALSSIIGIDTHSGLTVEIPLDHADPYNLTASKESRESLQQLVLWRLRHAAGGKTPRSTSAQAP